MHVHCTRREHSTFNGLTWAEEQRQRWITNKHKQITPLLTQFESTRNALMTWLNFWNQYEHKNIIAKARVNGNRSKGLLLYDSLSSWLFLKKRKTPRREKSTQIEVYAKSFSSSRSFTFVCVAWSGINKNCRPFKFCGTKKSKLFHQCMHSILQSISSGSQCAHIWHSSFENPFFSVCSTLGIHFILFRINKFSLLLLAFGWTFSYSTQTYTHMLMLTPTSTRTHIIYPIFCRCFVSRKCSFVFRLMILALEHTIEL